MNVAIAGYGVEGRASYDYYVGRGDTVTILDENNDVNAPAEAKVVAGTGAFTDLASYDIVLRTPPLPPARLSTAKKVWSGTNEFFAMCPVPIIGVTGTKGKGTTCSLIASILRESGKTVHLVGNIGTPALDVLPLIREGDIVVYELSSFQLWDLEKSPHIAVVLMIEPDHMDVHTSMQEYIDAKAKIAEHQTENDIAIYHPTNPLSSEIAMHGVAKKQRYGIVDDGAVYSHEGSFFVQNEPVASLDSLRIHGAHNIENACAAITASLVCGVSSASVDAGLRAFTGLPHRLKFVRENRGVRYFDDSIATTPGSAIAAMHSFDDPKTLILGGSDKGAVYDEVVVVAKQTGTRVIAIGQTGEKIAEICEAQGVPVTRETGLMQDVVVVAARQATAGSVVLLSPASASFDQYKSYSDRGDQFVRAVKELS